ncbi:MAG: sugar/nucleoside kinase (ribokinase family) [Sulfitobacter sp.]
MTGDAVKNGAVRSGVVCVGRLYCDLIFTDVPRLPTMGTEVYAGGFGLHAGGGACITAAHLAAHGRQSHLSSFLPSGPFGPTMKSEIKAAGVHLDLSRGADPDLPLQVTAALVGTEDRAFVTNRAGPAAPRLRAEQLREAGIAHMHIGELATLIEMPELLNLARGAGLTVSLDCSWDESIVATDAAQLIAAVDVFLPNAAEAARLTEMGIVAPFAPLTVIKDGANGASAWKAGREVHVAAERVKPVDTTGAGDAFNAGFLHAWLDGRALAECLSAGNHAGARAIGMRGGFGPLVAAQTAGLETAP